jgi:hypothetical protein
MLQCNMLNTLDIQLVLEDLLADLQFARKHDDLGRLALLAYCEVKGWARRAGKPDVADQALQMFSENPCLSKVEFLEGIDRLIAVLELHEGEYQRINARNALNASAIYASAESTRQHHHS